MPEPRDGVPGGGSLSVKALRFEHEGYFRSRTLLRPSAVCQSTQMSGRTKGGLV